jgi:hypothetical protein
MTLRAYFALATILDRLADRLARIRGEVRRGR